MIEFQVKHVKVTPRWDAAGDPIPDQNKVWLPDLFGQWFLYGICTQVDDDVGHSQNQKGRIVKNARLLKKECA